MSAEKLLVWRIYCLIIIFGCGYVVFELGRSPWWFLLALIFCSGEFKTEKE